jgi:hypothetical protein
MREFDSEIADRIRQMSRVFRCPHCRAILLQGMPDGFCCNPFGDRIRSKTLPPMDEGLLSRILELTKSNQKFPRLLNRDLRPISNMHVFHHPMQRPQTSSYPAFPMLLILIVNSPPLFMPFSVVMSGGCQDHRVTSKTLLISFCLETGRSLVISEID